MPDALERLFSASAAPIDVRDLGRGARLLIPNGAAFGAFQLLRNGAPWDWVRDRPDGYWVPGDRGASHAGADFAFFVRRGLVHHLPAGLPVRAPVDGSVEAAGKNADPEPGPGGVVIALGRSGRPRLYVHLTDFAPAVRRGARVRRGAILGETVAYSARHPIVVLHFGVGALVPGEPPNPLDPTPLFRRWGVRHPVRPGSTCDAGALNRGRSGRWTGPGTIEDLEPVATWRAAWRDVYD